MVELWKDIGGYDGFYLISSLGRVKSCKKNKFLKPFIGVVGYPLVGLSKNGRARQHSIHRLIGEAFIPNPENKPQINHIDGNKANSFLDNLEWVTPSENGLHAYKTGLAKVKIKYGDENHRSKRIKQTFQDGSFKIWDSMMSAKRFGYDTGCICRCCKGQSATHKGCKWEYTNDGVTEDTFNDKDILFKSEVFVKKCKNCNEKFKTANVKKIYCCRKCARQFYRKVHGK